MSQASTLSDQVSKLVAENRALRMKCDADEETITILKQQYDTLQAGVENMVEDHRRIERTLCGERDRAVRAYIEIEGLLNRTGDLILQAMRARIGDITPEKMPHAATPHLVETRIPQVAFS